MDLVMIEIFEGYLEIRLNFEFILISKGVCFFLLVFVVREGLLRVCGLMISLFVI